MSKVLCFHCSKDTGLSADSKVVRSEECPHCASSLHCCKMCKFYDKSAYNECKEPVADRIVEKEKANFCDFFVLGAGGDASDDKDGLVNAANSLFKD